MKPRVLFCITVYNGRAFVPAAIESAARIDRSEADIDVLILDDCSPDPGWSGELEQFCQQAGVHYYRSPRNLGIPRNVSLGLHTALDGGYDYVVINNSDVLYPRSLISDLLATARQPGVGSVTAWSNNVSVYSIPNEAPDLYLQNQDVVDWLASSLGGLFGGTALDIPAGISFCILIPRQILEEVGLMDPVFGRGYCEETDWSLRSMALGHRITLCRGTFVYHAGSGSTHSAGMLVPGATTVPENEAVIDMRYPQFRSQVRAFLGSGLLQRSWSEGIRRILTDAGRQFGYTLDVGWMPLQPHEGSRVQCIVAPEGRPTVQLRFMGFSQDLEFDGDDVLEFVEGIFDGPPAQVHVYDSGSTARRLSSSSGPIYNHALYPTRV